MKTLLTTFLLLALACLPALAANSTSHMWDGVPNYDEYTNMSVSATASTTTIKTCKRIEIQHISGASVCVNVAGGTPTASSNGTVITTGRWWSNEFVTVTIKAIVTEGSVANIRIRSVWPQ